MIDGERQNNAHILVGCLTARQHRKVNLCQLRGEKPAQSAKDGQQDTMQIALRYTITM